MFTGIIETTGEVISFTPGTGAARLTIAAPEIAGRLRTGDSVAVSGVCLTALEIEPGAFPPRFSADLAAETIARTTLSRLEPGSQVNLELPTPAGAAAGRTRGAGACGRGGHAGGARSGARRSGQRLGAAGAAARDAGAVRGGEGINRGGRDQPDGRGDRARRDLDRDLAPHLHGD